MDTKRTLSQYQKSKSSELQREDLLIAIDQLSQIAEVMQQTLNNIKHQVGALDNQQIYSKRVSHSRNKNTITYKTRDIH